MLFNVHQPIFAGSGNSCEDPIPLRDIGENGVQDISGPSTIWYIANTFDLPLAFIFYPDEENAAAPVLQLDFGCISGEYDDPILCRLFCTTSDYYLELPYEKIPNKTYDEAERLMYKVEFGKFYRDLLLREGIDYNVHVYIKVEFFSGGKLAMAPDAFTTCMDDVPFMQFGDKVEVKAGEKGGHVIVPYIQWQYDSIRYVWQGEKECIIGVGNNCSFDPTKNADVDNDYIDGGPTMPIQSGGAFKVSSDLLMQYVQDTANYPNEAGMYFAKFYSESDGVITIEKIPAPDPDGGAELLRYDRRTAIYRNNTEKVYAMPNSWVKDMQFTTPTDHVFRMYIGTTADFTKEDAFTTYQFDKTEDGHQLTLLAKEMKEIWKHKLEGTNYLYVRFECTDNTVVIPALWAPSDCMKTLKRIVPGKQFEVTSRSGTSFGLYYEEWKGGDMKIAWTNRQSASNFYIANTCNVPNSDTPPVFYTAKLPVASSVTIDEETVNSWAQKVDEDGYLYIRFYSVGNGKITVTTTAPEETDPPCLTVDSVWTVTAWDEYEWRGTTYTESGEYKDYDTEAWCPDTIFTLNLSLYTTYYETSTETGCDSVVIEGTKYTTSGTYNVTTLLENGDRKIQTRNVTVLKSTYSEQTISACEIYTAPSGKEYSISGEYKDTIPNVAGCDSIIALHVTVVPDCHAYDTVYFCEGFNYSHDELMNDEWVIRYRPYTYESPAEWDYMDGVELQHDGGKTLMDLHKAEENLYKHYTDSLMPITTISWSHRPEGKKTYEPITVEDEPQWIEAGSLALRLQFLCGETYSTSYVTDIDNVDADATPVKRIENGRVIILRGGVRYDMLGNVIK